MAFLSVFFPVTMYVTFVYGTIPGLAFSILAFYMELEYMRTGKLAYGIIAAASISFAIIWKTNSLVMFIAMCLFFVYDLIMEKGERKRKTLIVIAALIVFQRLGSWAVDAAMEGLTGTEVAEGMPKTAWVSMALQETGGTPGAWDGYSVGLYEANGYDYEKTNEAAKEKIAERIHIFLDDRSYGVDFFGRKNAAQWNDPAFGSLSVVDGREENGKKKLDNLCHGPLKYRMENMANYLHSAILIGVCFYLFLGIKKQKRGEMLLGTATVGGGAFSYILGSKTPVCSALFCVAAALLCNGLFGHDKKNAHSMERAEKGQGENRKKMPVGGGRGGNNLRIYWNDILIIRFSDYFLYGSYPERTGILGAV